MGNPAIGSPLVPLRPDTCCPSPCAPLSNTGQGPATDIQIRVHTLNAPAKIVFHHTVVPIGIVGVKPVRCQVLGAAINRETYPNEAHIEVKLQYKSLQGQQLESRAEFESRFVESSAEVSWLWIPLPDTEKIELSYPPWEP